MKSQPRKTARLAAKILVAFFLIAQHMLGSTSYGGAWCTPSLFGPSEDGHYTYRIIKYGPFLTVVQEDCYEAKSTAYEWSPVGVGVDGLLLVMIAYPLWRGMFVTKEHKRR